MMTEVWRLIQYNPDGDSSCEACGHPIKRIFTLRNQDGIQRKVGSECVNNILSLDERPAVDLLQRRIQRAERQWRENKPPHLQNETRKDYITRRVSEMANAMRGFKMCLATDFNSHVKRREAEANLPAYPKGLYGDEWYEVDQQWKAVIHAAHDELHRVIEQKCNANRYDYNQPIWKVRKI